jgi:hypothetical protein
MHVSEHVSLKNSLAGLQADTSNGHPPPCCPANTPSLASPPPGNPLDASTLSLSPDLTRFVLEATSASLLRMLSVLHHSLHVAALQAACNIGPSLLPIHPPTSQKQLLHPVPAGPVLTHLRTLVAARKKDLPPAAAAESLVTLQHVLYRITSRTTIQGAWVFCFLALSVFVAPFTLT